MKSIILDKNVLQGCNAVDLAKFSKKFRIILPAVLLAEIYTADQGNGREPHLATYYKKLKECRFTVTSDLTVVFQEEKGTGKPVRSIDNYKWTHWLVEQLKLPHERRQNPREWGRDGYAKDFSDLVSRRRPRLVNLARPEILRVTSQVAKIAQTQGKSLPQAWREALEPTALSVWKQNYPRLPQLATRKSFCFMAMCLENYADFRRSSEGMGSCLDANDEKLFNELADRDYILNLIVKDGIVSREPRFLETAKAFFPGRLVWESLKQGIEWSA